MVHAENADLIDVLQKENVLNKEMLNPTIMQYLDHQW